MIAVSRAARLPPHLIRMMLALLDGCHPRDRAQEVRE